MPLKTDLYANWYTFLGATTMGFSLLQIGKRFYFRCRVPVDLLPKFPADVIKKSLKTADKKQATLLASSIDFKTRKLFTELRTGMLDPKLEQYLIAVHLPAGLENIEADLYAKKLSASSPKSPLTFFW